MRRSTHTFQFTGEQISKAAEAEYVYHDDRADWWEEAYATAIVDAKAKGVQIREYDVTGGKRADIIIDPSVQGRVTESQMKRQSHRKRADDFQIEAATYGSQSDRMYELDGDDVMHFRLAGGEREG